MNRKKLIHDLYQILLNNEHHLDIKKSIDSIKPRTMNAVLKIYHDIEFKNAKRVHKDKAVNHVVKDR